MICLFKTCLFLLPVFFVWFGAWCMLAENGWVVYVVWGLLWGVGGVVMVMVLLYVFTVVVSAVAFLVGLSIGIGILGLAPMQDA